MTTKNALVQFVAHPLALAACVAIGLWVLLGVLRVERFAGSRQEGYPSIRLPIVASDSGLRVKLMQKALIGRGYFVGPAGADGEFNEHTMTALEAFQDNNALPIAPQCDQQCWNELSPSNAKTARRQ